MALARAKGLNEGREVMSGVITGLQKTDSLL
jgi:hypothetical protein